MKASPFARGQRRQERLLRGAQRRRGFGPDAAPFRRKPDGVEPRIALGAPTLQTIP